MQSMLAERFLKYYTAKKTIDAYALTLGQFARSAAGEGATLESLDALIADFKAGRRDPLEAVEGFYFSIKQLAPKTVSMKLSPVRMLLEDNDVELKARFWRRLKVGGRSGVLSIDQPPTHAEFKAMQAYLPLHMKALELMLASSGMRSGEALALRVQDVDLEAAPARAVVRAGTSKSRKSRVVFFSSEAAEAIRAWLKVKGDYCGAASRRYTRGRRPKDGEEWLFPFSYNNMMASHRIALKKAGLDQRDPTTGMRLRHPHTLRKFFKTEFTKAVKNPEIAEALMGHDAGVRTVYSKYTLDDLAKVYLEGEGALTVFSNRAEVAKLKGELEQKDRFTVDLVTGLGAELEKVKRDVVVLTEVLKKQGTIKVQ